jgi:hypothetical protein
MNKIHISQNTEEKNQNNNEKIIYTWKHKCSKDIYIYNYSSDKLLLKSKLMKIIIVVFASVQFALLTANVGLNNTINQNIILTIKIIIFILSLIMYAIVLYFFVQNYDYTIKEIAEYINDLKIFSKDIINAQNTNQIDDFIKINQKIYYNLQNRSPKIDINIYQESLNSYYENVNNVV